MRILKKLFTKATKNPNDDRRAKKEQYDKLAGGLQRKRLNGELVDLWVVRK